MKQLIFISMSVLFLHGCNKQKPKTELDEVRGKWELEAVYKYGIPNDVYEIVLASTSKKLTIEITKKNEIIFRNPSDLEFSLQIIKLEVETNSIQEKVITIKAKDKKRQTYRLYFEHNKLQDKLETMYYDPSKPILFNRARIIGFHNNNQGIGIYKRIE